MTGERLLTPEEIDKITHGQEVYYYEDFRALLQAQDAKTCTAKDAESQARVERIFEEIEAQHYYDKDILGPGEYVIKIYVDDEWWQALKQKEGL